MEGRNHKVELLAPAGNAEAFYGAVCGGADAVYLAGDRFGARAFAENFTAEKLLECIRYGHLLGKKLYLAVNTLLKEQELAGLYEYLLPFYEAGMDAVIVQDLGVFRLVREKFPGWKIHVSTQMTVCGGYGASLLKEMGACRVVPARELGLEELAAMKRQADIEIEAFVHGAMCYSYSGQCLFSSILGGRSGNRGRCAQPCRLSYSVDMDGAGLAECYPLSLKDLCTIEHIPELIEAGIDSFKIEGRMKKAEYAAGVTAVYRRYIDKYYELREEKGAGEAAEIYQAAAKDREILRSLYIRTKVQDGYYFRRSGREMVTMGSPSYSGSDEALLGEIREKYLGAPPKLPVSVEAVLREGEPAKVTMSWQDMSAGGRKVPVKPVRGMAAEEEPGSGRTAGEAICEKQSAVVSAAVTGAVVQRAEKQPVTEENIRKQLGRLGESVFYTEEMRITLGGNVFYPLKQLNELRREAVSGLEAAILSARGYGTETLPEAAGQGAPVFQESEGEQGAPVFQEPEREQGTPVFQEPEREQGTPVFQEPEGEQGTPDSQETEAGQGASLPREAEREQESPADQKAGCAQTVHRNGWVISVRTKPQLEAVTQWIWNGRTDEVVRVYVDGDLVVRDDVLELCGKLSSCCAVYAALPYILRASDRGYLDRLWEKVERSGGFRGFLARSMDGLGFVRAKGGAVCCRADAGVYAWNPSAVETLCALSEGFCLPYELKASEQWSLLRGLSPSERLSCEKIVYSRIPMMITANCLRRTAGQCGKYGDDSAVQADGSGKRAAGGSHAAKDRHHAVLKERHHAALEDRHHAALEDRHHAALKERHHATLEDRYHAVLKDRYRRGFPVVVDCLHCMNIIYNTVPFSLHRELSKWKGHVDLRVDFTLESGEETEKLLDAFPGGAGFPQMGETTSGHEKRGVD